MKKSGKTKNRRDVKGVYERRVNSGRGGYRGEYEMSERQGEGRRGKNDRNSRSGSGSRGGRSRDFDKRPQKVAYREFDPKMNRDHGRDFNRDMGRDFGDEANFLPVERENLLIGRNAVAEALKSGRQIDKITVLKGAEGSVKVLVAQAKDKGIPIYQTDRVGLDRMCPGGQHQGIVAVVSNFEYSTVEEILQVAKDRNEDPFIIILDNLEDPHNLGAIMRSGECAGAHGIIIPKRRAALVTDTVAKASAGAVEYMKVAKVTNITNAIEELKEQGVWIAACDMDGDVYYKANLKGSIAFVIGNEGAGISKLVKENCDFTVSMPMVGNITSLNASNAAAVLMYEIRKQRDTI